MRYIHKTLSLPTYSTKSYKSHVGEATGRNTIPTKYTFDVLACQWIFNQLFLCQLFLIVLSISSEFQIYHRLVQECRIDCEVIGAMTLNVLKCLLWIKTCWLVRFLGEHQLILYIFLFGFSIYWFYVLRSVLRSVWFIIYEV